MGMKGRLPLAYRDNAEVDEIAGLNGAADFISIPSA